ncbi:PREDICTED: uncharacterized protein LOC108614202 [Drosophila arizonae]|uniref:Uncharacterized protein LOC108614202 n=1 Tax=Drosophila arizonae TaxID=7263 RepID=A0ABM1P902_DROAR|nr:PREDICTED: uncharacterized protein LOC108614202 [Drosophila arizonae]
MTILPVRVPDGCVCYCFAAHHQLCPVLRNNTPNSAHMHSTCHRWILLLPTNGYTATSLAAAALRDQLGFEWTGARANWIVLAVLGHMLPQSIGYQHLCPYSPPGTFLWARVAVCNLCPIASSHL